ncbi:unnamed protein product [Euphydryas editha]|uniref:Uncharacterized protein n=1 Tax=Euphydryas editha TaxID=104508 RepID=A0AAU9V1K3_EUPED|nr:unnamed protein product [Euphydryas editha]
MAYLANAKKDILSASFFRMVWSEGWSSFLWSLSSNPTYLCRTSNILAEFGELSPHDPDRRYTKDCPRRSWPSWPVRICVSINVSVAFLTSLQAVFASGKKIFVTEPVSEEFYLSCHNRTVSSRICLLTYEIGTLL